MKEEFDATQVHDPFRSLEEDSEQTRAWMQEQSRRTERELDTDRDGAAGERLRQLLSIGEIADIDRPEIDPQMIGDLTSQCGMCPPSENGQIFVHRRSNGSG